MSSRVFPLVVAAGLGVVSGFYTFKPILLEFWASEEGQAKLDEYRRAKHENKAIPVEKSSESIASAKPPSLPK
eukprot:jgi/Bigna1/144331/aug1.86_g19039